MSRLRIEFFLQLVEDLRDRPHGDFSLVATEDLQEATHVGPLEVVRQTHGHRDRGRGLLLLVLLIQDGDRKGEVADADLIDGDAPGVGGLLNVWKFVFLRGSHNETFTRYTLPRRN